MSLLDILRLRGDSGSLIHASQMQITLRKGDFDFQFSKPTINFYQQITLDPPAVAEIR
jgi:hypothetical protein